MRALDTNVLARYVVGDDRVQSPAAVAILAEPCFVSLTVLLELGWLLSSRYGVGRVDLAATLLDLLSLPTLTVPRAEAARWAIGRFAAGADLADMLHLVSSLDGDGFATFDRRLATQAGSDAPLPIELLA